MPRRYPPFAVPVYASVGVNGGQCRMRRITLPAIPPVGGLRNTEIPPPAAHYTRKPHTNPLRFLHNDAARRVATVFEEFELRD